MAPAIDPSVRRGRTGLARRHRRGKRQPAAGPFENGSLVTRTHHLITPTTTIRYLGRNAKLSVVCPGNVPSPGTGNGKKG